MLYYVLRSPPPLWGQGVRGQAGSEGSKLGVRGSKGARGSELGVRRASWEREGVRGARGSELGAWGASWEQDKYYTTF